MEELLRETNKLLKCIVDMGKDPNELLTAEQVHKEMDIGINMVQKIFKDPELPVQRYTRPFRVTRKAINAYINKNRDYLCKE